MPASFGLLMGCAELGELDLKRHTWPSPLTPINSAAIHRVRLSGKLSPVTPPTIARSTVFRFFLSLHTADKLRGEAMTMTPTDKSPSSAGHGGVWNAGAPRRYSFGPFELLAKRGQLLRRGQPVQIGGKAVAILGALVERRGELVSDGELIERAWPGGQVEPNNLRVHITALRKVLGELPGQVRYISNESGRGYRFTVPVELAYDDVGGAEDFRVDFPFSLTPLIGRDEAISALIARLVTQRLVTVVGPGGIGKSSLALATTAQFIGPTLGGCIFVDLSSLLDPALVPSAIALALQLPMTGADPLVDLVSRLRSRKLTIILDNCEHLIGAAAVAAEAILVSCPEVRIIATSREALRIPGETLYWLSPLESPAEIDEMSAADALTYSAVHLFAERAGAANSSFRLTNSNASTVGRICLRLDGLPLAIELAAAAAATIGLSELADGLDDRLSIPGQDAQSPRRHQTMRAMLDWSYDLLEEEERRTLAMLAVFRGAFTIEAASAVAEGTGSPCELTLSSLASLVDKSLISANVSGLESAFHLLDTTRAYAAEKLEATGETWVARRRHASFLSQGLSDVAGEWLTIARSEWWDAYGPRLDDVRAALDWAFSGSGDERLGIVLTVASIPLWMGLSKLREFRMRLVTALNWLGPAGLLGSEEEIRLNLALAAIVINTHGPNAEEVLLFNRALKVARSTGDAQSELTARWGLAGERHSAGDYRAMKAMAEKVVSRAQELGDAESLAMAERFLALANYRTGRLSEASVVGERLAAAAEPAIPGFRTARHDQGSAARANHACVLWLRGFADQARAMMGEAVDRASRTRNPSSLCYILSQTACPMALWLDDADAAGSYIRLLIEQSDENGFDYMRWWARIYGCLLTIGQEGATSKQSELRTQFPHFRLLEREIFISVNSSLVDLQDVERTRSEPAWCSAEILRARGEQMSDLVGEVGWRQARALFASAIEIARAQGALAWELRAATSQARLDLRLGRRVAGLDVLAPVIEKFTEGFETADFVSARELLARLT